jgi:hypothetical protein
MKQVQSQKYSSKPKSTHGHSIEPTPTRCYGSMWNCDAYKTQKIQHLKQKVTYVNHYIIPETEF